MRRALVTGGAGFIGSHLVDRLVELGMEVKVVDNLHDWSHKGKPDYLNPKATYFFGSLADPEVQSEALKGVDTVYHLAAVLGLEASQREPEVFIKENTLATATLLKALRGGKEPRAERIITASSNTVYGEGPAQCPKCKKVLYPGLRTAEALGSRKWEPMCPDCDVALNPLPTGEDHPLRPASVYALTKMNQETLASQLAPLEGIESVVLRFFNVYGPRQSPTNPYAGVISIFRGRLQEGRRPQVYEDGKQTRDFVSVRDVVEALVLAGTAKVRSPSVFNVGTGVPTPVIDLAGMVTKLAKSPIEPEVLNKARSVDVRHTFADTTRAGKELGYRPRVGLKRGLEELLKESNR